MKKPALLLVLITVVAIGTGLFCTYWLRSAKDYEAADAPLNLKNIAQRVSEKNREYRKSTFWWSTAFHGSLLLAAFLSAASGIILKVESAGANRVKLKTDLAAIFAGSLAWMLRLIWESRFGHSTLIFKLGEVFVPMTAATLVYLWASA